MDKFDVFLWVSCIIVFLLICAITLCLVIGLVVGSLITPEVQPELSTTTTTTTTTVTTIMTTTTTTTTTSTSTTTTTRRPTTTIHCSKICLPYEERYNITCNNRNECHKQRCNCEFGKADCINLGGSSCGGFAAVNCKQRY